MLAVPIGPGCAIPGPSGPVERRLDPSGKSDGADEPVPIGTFEADSFVPGASLDGQRAHLTGFELAVFESDASYYVRFPRPMSCDDGDTCERDADGFLRVDPLEEKGTFEATAVGDQLFITLFPGAEGTGFRYRYLMPDPDTLVVRLAWEEPEGCAGLTEEPPCDPPWAASGSGWGMSRPPTHWWCESDDDCRLQGLSGQACVESGCSTAGSEPRP